MEIYQSKGNYIKDQLKHALYEAELYNKHRLNNGKKKIQKCRISAFYKESYGNDIGIYAPVGLTVTDIQNRIEFLEMALDAEILLDHTGQYVHFKVGKCLWIHEWILMKDY